MYTSIHQLGLRSFLQKEVPALVSALFIAEIFYKFGSFIFESVAFLFTWILLSYALQKLAAWVRWKKH